MKVKSESEVSQFFYEKLSPNWTKTQDQAENKRCCCCCWSITKSCLTLCDLINCSMPGFPVLHYLLAFAQTHIHWVDDAIQPSCPLCPLFLLPSIFPSLRVFSSELALCIRWSEYWNFSLRISPSSEYLELISFRIDWFDLSRVFSSTTVWKYQFFRT